MSSSTDAVEVTPALLRSLPLPEPGSDKESRGRVLVVAGTPSTPGAALLAGEAALRAGAGKLTVMTSAVTAVPLAVALPEAMVEPLTVTTSGHPDVSSAERVLDRASDVDVVLVGCGFFDPGATLAFLRAVVPRLAVPLLLDAAASVYAREEQDGLGHLDGRAILTVNPSELALTDGSDDETLPDGPHRTAGRVAERTGAVVLCGGPTKYIRTPAQDAWVFSGGGPTLAVSGSGDVQAGIVAGLLARGAEPSRAAIWGAYAHGRAGERLGAEIGPVGSLSREQLPQVTQALREIH